MSWTQADVDALKTAMAKGASMVRIGDEQVQFRSVNEMRSLLTQMERALAGVTAPALQTYPRFVARPT